MASISRGRGPRCPSAPRRDPKTPLEMSGDVGRARRRAAWRRRGTSSRPAVDRSVGERRLLLCATARAAVPGHDRIWLRPVLALAVAGRRRGPRAEDHLGAGRKRRRADELERARALEQSPRREAALRTGCSGEGRRGRRRARPPRTRAPPRGPGRSRSGPGVEAGARARAEAAVCCSAASPCSSTAAEARARAGVVGSGMTPAPCAARNHARQPRRDGGARVSTTRTRLPRSRLGRAAGATGSGIIRTRIGRSVVRSAGDLKVLKFQKTWHHNSTTEDKRVARRAKTAVRTVAASWSSTTSRTTG